VSAPLDRWTTTLTSPDRKLYRYAISCALSALVGHAGRWGRGWYHFADGEMIVAAEVLL
jgi:hypothetical protein